MSDTVCVAPAFPTGVELIREAFHYQSRFAGSTMVFKIDFPITEDPAFPLLMRDIVLLSRTGFRVVIVPGAKEWIDAVLDEYGIASSWAGDYRITTAKAMPFVEMAAFHVANRFMTGLSADRVDAVIGNFVRARGLGVVDGVDMEHTGRVDRIHRESLERILGQNMVPILPCIGWSPTGKPYNVQSDEIALQVSAILGAVKLFIVSAGDAPRFSVRAVPPQDGAAPDAGALRYGGVMRDGGALRSAGAAPGVPAPNAGASRYAEAAPNDGKPDAGTPRYAGASPAGAAPDAGALREGCGRAEGRNGGPWILPPGIPVRENGRISRLTPTQAETVVRALEQALAGGAPEPGDAAAPPVPAAGVAKFAGELRLALRAARMGMERIHLVDGRESGSVLRELFSNLGSGIMVYADEYDSIRPLKTRDIADILRLMEPLMREGILIRRRAQDIQEKKDDYVVFEMDGAVHACGALHDWGEGQGEIAAIATDPLYSAMGLGRQIVNFLVNRARERGLRRVFVLTTRTQDWFELLGFRESAVESLPERKRKVYDRNRRSRVFALDIESGVTRTGA